MINPIFLQIGPLQLRWYGLAYILGLALGLLTIKKTLQHLQFSRNDQWDLMTYAMIGILLGGRLGYILFYDLSFYLQNPGEIVALWHGGMAYHGGALGCLLAVILFCKHKQKPLLNVLDALGLASTLGIFMGRIANFINGELYGRITTLPWGMVFPTGGPFPRHPSQLYEAFFEGLVLFFLLKWASKKALKPGQLFGLYLSFYGIFRFYLEFFREPDAQLGFIVGSLTMGQLLCLLMIGTGFILFYRCKTRHVGQ